ncbi:hypothetical protein ABD91_00045, partial [Lysinibacillus sphaericus]|uniref:hypothetical protein n=1 Tax=Lysinibacillus sphaericus TaxID=1421 RepID=UPI0018CEC8FF
FPVHNHTNNFIFALRPKIFICITSWSCLSQHLFIFALLAKDIQQHVIFALRAKDIHQQFIFALQAKDIHQYFIFALQAKDINISKKYIIISEFI